MSALYPLLFREMKVKIKWRVMLLTQLVNPLAYLFLFAMSLRASFQEIKYAGFSIDYIAFILPGLIILQTYQAFHFTMAMTRNEKRWGVLRTLLTSRASPIDYILAKIFVEGIIIFAQCLFLLSLGIYFSADLAARFGLLSLLVLLVLVVSSSVFWSVFGIFVGMLIETEQMRDLVLALLGLCLSFSSTALYPLDAAPVWVRALSMINPITYASDTCRTILFRPLHASLYGIALMIIMSGLCIFLTERYVGRAKLISEEK